MFWVLVVKLKVSHARGCTVFVYSYDIPSITLEKSPVLDTTPVNRCSNTSFLPITSRELRRRQELLRHNSLYKP